jgi:hypothetical protein
VADSYERNAAEIVRRMSALSISALPDRVMVGVLAAAPPPGLKSVLVAVSLLLEGDAPSGSTRAEHVRNVLARLNNTGHTRKEKKQR